MKMQDIRFVPMNDFTTTKCVKLIKIFMNLAKYYYNTTYLFTPKAHDHKRTVFQILVNHINIIIVMKLCQIQQIWLPTKSLKNIVM